ncbi:adenine phosphoribosyltransferase [Actinomadura sp. DC4]|uniref:adenine phosphoribosyltransferase n=1 Tax=Actinomadura sp. DC4 TaxID=3055069 RepID=UPI0025B2648C|nr:adenine phosphoribosyltransferase [Actinomadura sp. DC4]MDN3358033.1 adenine phosphoribosyltransferase [Actinomadura sp. DC4]
MTSRPVDLTQLITDHIREVPDYPKQGVVFKDITPLLADHTAFAAVVDAIVAHYGRGTIDKVAGVEARGFILAAPVAYHFGAGFVPVRKKGKLPAATYAESYDLEYGAETIEVHQDAFAPGERVLIVDDVLATGGTARAAADLVRRTGAEVTGFSVLMELGFLHGRDKVGDLDVHALVTV